ncbi:MAG: hypothetical protein LBQ54_05095 [Planctomycetaceae bacterium]|jgi:hypothetical protein|nr:hypothetical protein [Planctomycetaceae bacterium]
MTMRKISGFVTGLLILSVLHFVLPAQQPSPAFLNYSEFGIDDLKSGIQKRQEVPLHLREGTACRNQICEFQFSGNRVLLLTNNGLQRFRCLENLNLDRIAQVLNSEEMLNQWVVDYTVTEYQGENYVLVNRAMLHRPSLVPDMEKDEKQKK